MSTYILTPTTEQEEIMKAFLEASEISFVKDDEDELPTHVLAGIEKGRKDIKAGRFITYEDIKKKYPIAK